MDNLKENSKINIMPGFRKTGIHPFNPSEVLKKIAEWHDQVKEVETVDQTVFNFLKEMRYGTINVVVPKKKEKASSSGRKECIIFE